MSNTLEDIEDMPAVETMMAAKYLSATDIAGESETVIIRRIQRAKETFEAGRKDEVNVIGIERADGHRAEMIWCKTNVAACRVLFGDDNTKWIGKRIVLVADEEKNRGEIVVALRISGSPDAPPGRAKAFQQAWDHPDGRMNGRKSKSSLVTRLKVIIARSAVKRPAKPAATEEKPAPAPSPRAEPNAEQLAHLAELEKPLYPEPPAPADKPMREPGDDVDV